MIECTVVRSHDGRSLQFMDRVEFVADELRAVQNPAAAEAMAAYMKTEMPRASESEFFIRKAVGWVLREYAKTAPESVSGFVLSHRDRWSGLTFREATKHLDV